MSFQSQLSFNWQANTNQCPKNYSCCITIFEVEKWDIENNSFIVCSPFSLTGSTSSNFYSLKLTFKELNSDIHCWNIKFRNEKELQLLLTPSKDLWRNKFNENYRSLFLYTLYLTMNRADIEWISQMFVAPQSFKATSCLEDNLNQNRMK